MKMQPIGSGDFLSPVLPADAGFVARSDEPGEAVMLDDGTLAGNGIVGFDPLDARSRSFVMLRSQLLNRFHQELFNVHFDGTNEADIIRKPLHDVIVRLLNNFNGSLRGNTLTDIIQSLPQPPPLTRLHDSLRYLFEGEFLPTLLQINVNESSGK